MSTPFTDQTYCYTLMVDEELRQNGAILTYKGRYLVKNKFKDERLEEKGNGVIKYYFHSTIWSYVCEINKRLKDAQVPHSFNFLGRASHNFYLNDTPQFIQGTFHKILYDYIEGSDLYEFITQHRFKITDHHIAIILKQILEWHDGAISKCKILHRDLSVTNVIINSNENIIENPELINITVIDYDSAKILDENESVTDSLASSKCKRQVPFAAPELWLRNQFNIKSDIWSIGAILYCLLTGNIPPTDKDAVTLNNNGCNYNTVLKDMFEQMTKKNPSLRPTAKELLNDNKFKDLYKGKLIEHSDINMIDKNSNNRKRKYCDSINDQENNSITLIEPPKKKRKINSKNKEPIICQFGDVYLNYFELELNVSKDPFKRFL
eukprot:208259_1